MWWKHPPGEQSQPVVLEWQLDAFAWAIGGLGEVACPEASAWGAPWAGTLLGTLEGACQVGHIREEAHILAEGPFQGACLDAAGGSQGGSRPGGVALGGHPAAVGVGSTPVVAPACWVGVERGLGGDPAPRVAEPCPAGVLAAGLVSWAAAPQTAVGPAGETQVGSLPASVQQARDHALYVQISQ